jgi:hypothetical protein
MSAVLSFLKDKKELDMHNYLPVQLMILAGVMAICSTPGVFVGILAVGGAIMLRARPR